MKKLTNPLFLDEVLKEEELKRIWGGDDTYGGDGGTKSATVGTSTTTQNPAGSGQNHSDSDSDQDSDPGT